MTQTVKPARFLFNEDFAVRKAEDATSSREAPAPTPEPPTILLEAHEALLAEAEKAAYERGLAQGEGKGASAAEARLAEEVERLTGEVASLLDQLDDQKARVEKDAIALAFLIGRRLCAHLIAREPLGEIVALISESLGPLRRAPHLVVRVSERDVEGLKERVEPLIHERGFDGRLIILGEPEVSRGDCRIEWADGGIIRDRSAIEKQLDQAVKRYFAGREGKNEVKRPSKNDGVKHDAGAAGAGKEQDQS